MKRGWRKKADNISVATSSVSATKADDATKSAEEKRWLELYEKHAPANESLEHFQKSHNYNLAKAEEQFSGLDDATNLFRR